MILSSHHGTLSPTSSQRHSLDLPLELRIKLNIPLKCLSSVFRPFCSRRSTGSFGLVIRLVFLFVWSLILSGPACTNTVKKDSSVTVGVENSGKYSKPDEKPSLEEIAEINKRKNGSPEQSGGIKDKLKSLFLKLKIVF